MKKKKRKNTKNIVFYGANQKQISPYGLRSMLAVLSVAMYILYKKTSALHIKLLLESGFNYLNKHKISDLTNFIYYKLSKIVSNLLTPVRLRWKTEKVPSDNNPGQLDLAFN